MCTLDDVTNFITTVNKQTPQLCSKGKEKGGHCGEEVETVENHGKNGF